MRVALLAETEELLAARRELRRQIALLEARGGRASGTGEGPRLLSLGELEAVRDALAASSGQLRASRDHKCPLDGARGRFEAMVADPAGHRRTTVSLAELGLPGCGSYRVKPRLGIIGMLAGWWQITLSSGCP
ncbi:MAG: hypothetical protein ACJ762_21580 [Solirubrobacteraceae bacterium]